MQATLESLEQYGTRETIKISKIARVFERLFAEIFGCQHSELSRPFSRQGETFRVCITCGARRQFDARKWSMKGSFYYKPARVAELRRY